MDTIKLPLLAIRSTLPGFARSAPVVHAFAVDAQIASGKIGYSLRQQLMFDFQHTRGQGVGGVGIVYGHGALGDDGAAIELGGNEVHGAAREAAAFVDGALVGVQAGEGRQQRGMDVDEAALIMRAKFAREDFQVACEQHEVGPILLGDFEHGAVEIGAAGEIAGAASEGGDALGGGPLEPGGVGVVGEHGGDADAGDIGLNHGLHVAAAAGDEDDDVFHGVELRRGFGMVIGLTSLKLCFQVAFTVGGRVRGCATHPTLCGLRLLGFSFAETHFVRFNFVEAMLSGSLCVW